MTKNNGAESLLLSHDFEATITFVSTEDGGRVHPAGSVYRPQLHYPGSSSDWIIMLEWINKEWVLPGETVEAKCSLVSPWFHMGYLVMGRRFLLREGQRVVARAKVSKLGGFNNHAIENLKEVYETDWSVFSTEGLPLDALEHLPLKNLLVWIHEHAAKMERQGILVDDVIYPSELTDNLAIAVTMFGDKYCGRLTIWSSGEIEHEILTILTSEKVSASSVASSNFAEQQKIFTLWCDEILNLEKAEAIS